MTSKFNNAFDRIDNKNFQEKRFLLQDLGDSINEEMLNPSNYTNLYKEFDRLMPYEDYVRKIFWHNTDYSGGFLAIRLAYEKELLHSPRNRYEDIKEMVRRSLFDIFFVGTEYDSLYLSGDISGSFNALYESSLSVKINKLNSEFFNNHSVFLGSIYWDRQLRIFFNEFTSLEKSLKESAEFLMTKEKLTPEEQFHIDKYEFLKRNNKILRENFELYGYSEVSYKRYNFLSRFLRELLPDPKKPLKGKDWNKITDSELVRLVEKVSNKTNLKKELY